METRSEHSPRERAEAAYDHLAGRVESRVQGALDRVSDSNAARSSTVINNPDRGMQHHLADPAVNQLMTRDTSGA